MGKQVRKNTAEELAGIKNRYEVESVNLADLASKSIGLDTEDGDAEADDAEHRSKALECERPGLERRGLKEGSGWFGGGGTVTTCK